jgi:hypothetical protein
MQILYQQRQRESVCVKERESAIPSTFNTDGERDIAQQTERDFESAPKPLFTSLSLCPDLPRLRWMCGLVTSRIGDDIITVFQKKCTERRGEREGDVEREKGK